MSANMEEQKEFNNKDIPKFLTINNFKYSFKCLLTNSQYSYRCYHRACKVFITIQKDQIDKILNKGNISNEEDIEYKTNKKEHTCQSIIKTTKLSEINTEKEEDELINKLIKNNLDKPCSWHQQNLLNNGIQISKIKIKNKLQNIRQQEYPKDDEYLLDLSKITISFSDID